jgi:cyclopropane-fatty-acyl-phospholipid synthase
MQRILHVFLTRLVEKGRLMVRWPDDTVTMYGDGDGPSAAIHITDAATVRRLVVNPSMAAGEAYMDETLIPIDCSIYDFLDVTALNMQQRLDAHPIAAFNETIHNLLRRVKQFNSASRSRRNVAHHYDLNGRLYSLFLDRDRQYSCAYFRTGRETLEEAQAAKKRHIAAKLKLDRPGLTVLDIGCGWGGTALTLARDFDAVVTGITLSSEQLTEARARAAAEGLDDRVTFELMDYRSLNQRFDRIVSVGMFEHVGIGHYGEFFDVVSRSLADDGVALLHSIGRSDGPGSTNPWFGKYIFPGGYSPALSEVVPHVERSGLVATDIEILRLHYAETLRHWRRRFAANRDAIATLYDERFCRMFEFYLAGSEMAFRRQGHMNFQIQLAHVQTAVPTTRDYITDVDRRVAQIRQDA